MPKARSLWIISDIPSDVQNRVSCSDVTCFFVPDLWKDGFFPILPWKKHIKTSRFELSNLNSWASEYLEYLIRNIVALIFKEFRIPEIQSTEPTSQSYGCVSTQHWPFPIHVWMNWGSLILEKTPIMQPALLLMFFLCVTGDLVRCQHVDGYLTCPQRELWQLHWHHTKC